MRFDIDSEALKVEFAAEASMPGPRPRMPRMDVAHARLQSQNHKINNPEPYETLHRNLSFLATPGPAEDDIPSPSHPPKRSHR